MKRKLIFFSLLLLGLPPGLAVSAHAQSLGQALANALNKFTGPENEAASEQELRSFDRYMQDHPDTGRALRNNPQLVNDRGFVRDHEDLQTWLGGHPDAANAFRSNPEEFMRQERHFQTYEGDFRSGDQRRGELAHFDWFLDSHREIRGDLMRRPELATRDEYLNNHPELRRFLDNHPIVRNQLRDDPRAFMDREQRLDAENRER